MSRILIKLENTSKNVMSVIIG